MRTVLRIALVTAFATIPAAAHAQSMPGMKAPAGKDATISGIVVDVSCKFGQGLGGPDHKMCSEVCADKGLPLAILTNDGKLYIPTTSAMPGEGQNGKLRAFAEQRVTVKGKVFEAGGAKAIQIASITKAQ